MCVCVCVCVCVYVCRPPTPDYAARHFVSRYLHSASFSIFTVQGGPLTLVYPKILFVYFGTGSRQWMMYNNDQTSDKGASDILLQYHGVAKSGNNTKFATVLFFSINNCVMSHLHNCLHHKSQILKCSFLKSKGKKRANLTCQ